MLRSTQGLHGSLSHDHTCKHISLLKSEGRVLHKQSNLLCAQKEGHRGIQKTPPPLTWASLQCLSLSLSHTCTHTRTCTLACMHACMHARTHTLPQRWLWHSLTLPLVRENSMVCSGLEDITKRIPSHVEIVLLSGAECGPAASEAQSVTEFLQVPSTHSRGTAGSRN